MGNKVSTNITISPELKKEATELFKELGLDLSTAVNMFLSQAARERGFPFEISTCVLENDEEIKSKKISVNLSIDSAIKQRAIKLFKKLGVSLSTAISLFLQQAVVVEGIPFYITKEVPNEETLQAIAEIKEMKEHPEKYKDYSSVEELMEDILNDSEEDD